MRGGVAWYEIRQEESPTLVKRRGVLGVGARADRAGPTYLSRRRSIKGAGDGWRGIGLGLSPWQEAFDAEPTPIMMGLHILTQRGESEKSFTFFTDSQAAIRGTLSDAPGPG